MTNLTSLCDNSAGATYRVKWYVEHPVAKWEQSDVFFKTEEAVKLFKQKIDSFSRVLIVEELEIAGFFANVVK